MNYNTLPFELRLTIAECDFEAFNLLREVDEQIRSYTDSKKNYYFNFFTVEKEYKTKNNRQVVVPILPNGKYHGLYKCYKEFKRNDVTRYVLNVTQDYVQGLKHGLKTKYNRNNVILETINYVNGVKCGYKIKYTEHGGITDKLLYDNGKLILSEEYYKGKIFARKGRLIHCHHHSNGNISHLIESKCGTYGTITAYHPNGKIKYIEHVKLYAFTPNSIPFASPRSYKGSNY